jgi:hypothetical protein
VPASLLAPLPAPALPSADATDATLARYLVDLAEAFEVSEGRRAAIREIVEMTP